MLQKPDQGCVPQFPHPPTARGIAAQGSRAGIHLSSPGRSGIRNGSKAHGLQHNSSTDRQELNILTLLKAYRLQNTLVFQLSNRKNWILSRVFVQFSLSSVMSQFCDFCAQSGLKSPVSVGSNRAGFWSSRGLLSSKEVLMAL